MKFWKRYGYWFLVSSSHFSEQDCQVIIISSFVTHPFLKERRWAGPGDFQDEELNLTLLMHTKRYMIGKSGAEDIEFSGVNAGNKEVGKGLEKPTFGSPRDLPGMPFRNGIGQGRSLGNWNVKIYLF